MRFFCCLSSILLPRLSTLEGSYVHFIMAFCSSDSYSVSKEYLKFPHPSLVYFRVHNNSFLVAPTSATLLGIPMSPYTYNIAYFSIIASVFIRLAIYLYTFLTFVVGEHLGVNLAPKFRNDDAKLGWIVDGIHSQSKEEKA